MDTATSKQTLAAHFTSLHIVTMLLALLLFSSPEASANSSSASQAEALLKWKSTLQTTSLSQNSSWLPSSSPCAWFGVSCDAAGSVIGLNLTETGLTGTLHQFPFRSLHSLMFLDLDINELSGAIPAEIGELSNLVYLDLSTNHFSGSIPPEIGLLTKLQTLHLKENQLSGSIPQGIGQLKYLTELALYTNMLGGAIPSSLGNLTKLQRLYLYQNNLSGSIPAEIGNLTNLLECYLDQNSLTGSLPSSLGNLRNLTVLHIFDNRLSGHIPNKLGDLFSITDLDLSYNQFNGSIPASLGFLSNLRYLRLRYNQLSGSIPPSISLLSNLIVFNLRGNKLNGSIPASLGFLSNLQYLALKDNQLSGSIPPSLGHLSNLTVFEIRINQLNGLIPASLGRLSNLKYLILGQNQLSGGLPADFRSLSNLIYLDLSENKLNVSIPKVLSSLTSLYYLNLRDNEFNGVIPVELSWIKRLSHLDFSANLLKGEIPSVFGLLENLEYLNLSRNGLSGSIPRSFKSLYRLQNVDVSENQLQGPIPENQAFQSALVESFRGNRGLCGNASGLQPCLEITGKSNKHGRKVIILTLSLVLGAILLSLVGLGVFLLRRKYLRALASRSDGLFLIQPFFDGRVMYEEIMQETECFDEMYSIRKGGSSYVYKAHLPSAGTVAVKKLHNTQTHGDYQKEFLSEIKALTVIRHRNIVKLYGFCSHAGHAFLVYQFVHRGSLADTLREDGAAKELDWEKRVNIIKGVAHAMAYLHHDCSPPILHRDISSNNVLLDSEFEPRVSDFGTAKLLTLDHTSWSSVVGTYGYIAPELAYTTKATEKSDVYSFGMLALEVIKGRHPGDTMSSLVFPAAEEDLCVRDDLWDPRLPAPNVNTIDKLTKIIEIAVGCVSSKPELRPTMRNISEVLSALVRKTNGGRSPILTSTNT